MFSRKSVIFFVIIAVLMSFSASCGWWKKLTGSTTPSPTPFVAQEIPTNIPFQTKEPESYEAEFIVLTFSGDEKIVKKTFTAKNGIKYFTTFNQGEKSAFSTLRNETGNVFLISDDKKVFAEEIQAVNLQPENEESVKSFLMTEWLNGKTNAAFENLETENNVTVFRVNLDSAQNTEILLYVDENLKMPVKHEFYSLSGGEKKLLFSAEIVNFKSGADEKYFQLPADYKKVSREEFDKIVNQDK
jgi:hypothetical protein